MSTQATAYTNLQKTATGAACVSMNLKLVVPGDAATSLLYEKVVANPPCGLEMPYGCSGSSCLSASQVQDIEDWINEGAKND
jgi:hypothetical protein